MTKYFLYSDEQIDEKNKILSKASKEFEPGVVVVNGVKKRFTQLSSSPDMPRFVDTKVIASGELDNFVYTMPSSTTRKGDQ